MDPTDTRPLAIAKGEPLRLDAGLAPGVAASIFQRIAARPDGLLRSYRPDGQHLSISYSAAWTRSGIIAARLASNGAVPGQHVVVLADDIVDFAPAFWACLRGGYPVVALMDAARDAVHRGDSSFAEILFTLENPLVLVDETFADLAGAHLQHFREKTIRLTPGGGEDDWQDPDTVSDPACLIATSGSTGSPKLAILSNRTLIARNFAAVNPGLSEPPEGLGIFPLDTMTGQFPLYLHYRSWTHMRAQDLIAHPSMVFDAVEELGITSISLTSSLVRRILAHEQGKPKVRTLTSLRSVGIGSEPVSAGLMQDLARLLQRCGAASAIIQAGYGTTETGALVAASKRGLDTDPSLPAPLGPPSPGVEMRIVGDAREVLAEGETGEVQVRCPERFFSGYWGDQPGEAVDGFVADGWWRTGDEGELRRGELTLHGRTRDVLIIGGKKLSLVAIDRELEAPLASTGQAHCFVERNPGSQEELGIAVRCDGLENPVAIASLLRSTVARRFGVTIKTVRQVSDFPTTRNGKLRRDLLAGNMAASSQQTSARFLRGHAWEGAEELVVLVTRIWCDALGLSPEVDPNTDFFSLGGDSLRALILHTQISETVGVHIESDAFFANPTLSHLLVLVEAALASIGPAEPESIWPLSSELHRRTLAPLETWPGERLTPSRLVVGHHTHVQAPPIFWVLNTRFELDRLLGVLGDARPVYAFRSALAGRDLHEANIQSLALRYVADIESICPQGPIFIGGHCQGGVIALALAQHALRRRRHVPLLILMDWLAELQPYAGRVMLVSGRQNLFQNPRIRFGHPERGWRRAFASFEHVEIDGGYALDTASLGDLERNLNRGMTDALSAPTTLLPADAYRVTITGENLASVMCPGERRTFRLTVQNDSNQAWFSGSPSGLTVAARWSDQDGNLLQETSVHAPLPRIDAGESAPVDLDIVAPNETGQFQLHIDVCDQGSKWFHNDPAKAFTTLVSVRPEERKRVGFSFTKVLAQLGRSAGPYRFDMKSRSHHLLRSGWSAPEEWGVWSVGDAATLTLPVSDLRGSWRVVLTMSAFGRPGREIPVFVSLNPDTEPLSWLLPANVVLKREVDFRCAGQNVTLRFATPEAISPFELGASHDRRRLAIGLVEMQFRKIGRPWASRSRSG